MKKFYITTAIDYVNGPPHLGHLLEKVQADCFARYKRLKGEDVFFLTGTDEHGIKIEKKAQELGITPKELADKNSALFQKLCEDFSISNDFFIRTTDEKTHFPGIKLLWETLSKKGDIYKKKYKGLYCQGCEAFLLEKDLVDGMCQLHKKAPELIEDENYFFKLSKYEKQIKEALEKDEVEIIPEKRKNEVLSFLQEGLEDISFSRDRNKVKWGFEVPADASQTIYVWADALTNYLSAVGYGRNNDYLNYWPADVHFIGKDIIKFHAIYWLGMLLALGLPLPKKIFCHGFLNVEGKKMSKSLGNVINPFDLLERYPSDAIRYFLLKEVPPFEDGNFSYSAMERIYKGELADGLGNLFSRTLSLAKIYKIEFLESEQFSNNYFKEKYSNTEELWHGTLDGFKFNDTIKIVWGFIGFCNEVIEEEKLWEVDERKESTLKDIILSLYKISTLIQPFMPKTSETINRNIHKNKEGKILISKEKIILFPKI
ncbi:Methionine--tRNA ligase [bacterium HR34]|nr:Methionine--tRNA ligase [bacterium HR34]